MTALAAQAAVIGGTFGAIAFAYLVWAAWHRLFRFDPASPKDQFRWPALGPVARRTVYALVPVLAAAELYLIQVAVANRVADSWKLIDPSPGEEKPDPKADPKPDPKLEPKPDPKGGAKGDLKADPKADQAEPKPDPKQQAKRAKPGPLELEFVDRAKNSDDPKSREERTVRVNEHVQQALKEPFRGLAFNGTLADPKLLAIWLLNNKEPVPTDPKQKRREYRAEEFTPESLEKVSREVEKQATWAPGVRWVHRVCGSDEVGYIVLVLAYTVFLYCVLAYGRRAIHFYRLRGFWDQEEFNDDDPPRPVPRSSKLRVNSRNPAEPAEVFLAHHGGDEWTHELDELNDGEEKPLVLPLKVLKAAMTERKAAPWSHEREVAHQRYREAVNRIEERYEARLATIQYFAQIIAPLGFIGTVLHLGLAMGHAQTLSSGGGIGRVTASLGMAFDTTFVALVMWIMVELLAVVERVNRRQVRGEAERMVGDSVFSTNAKGQVSHSGGGGRP